MPANKNQHFVPRCHLRPFTEGAQGKTINIFNIKKRAYITGAPVKNQCSRDYFYGKDDQLLENAIQSVESGYSHVMQEVFARSRKFTDEQKVVFRTFWLFQYFRTEAAAVQAAKMAEQTRKFAGLPISEHSISLLEAVHMGCRMFAKSMHELDDLQFCIVKNLTSVPFITSDNPAVLTNRWYFERKRHHDFSFGIGSSGIIAILPLAPKLLLLGFDSDVYDVTCQNGIAEIRNAYDAKAFNRHQLLNCDSNVYLHNVGQEGEIAKLFGEIEFLRLKNKSVSRLAELDKREAGISRFVYAQSSEREPHKEAIIHTQARYPNPINWPQIIRLKLNGSVYTNGSAVGYVRLMRALRGPLGDVWRERA
jgi:hypothetical protein